MWSRRSLSTYRAELGPPLRGDSINFTGEIFISFLSSDSPEKNDPATARLTPAFILLRPLLPRSHLSRNWSNADSKKFSILLTASNSRNFVSNFEDEDDKVESRLVRANEIQITWFARWTSGPGGGERGGRKSSMTR